MGNDEESFCACSVKELSVILIIAVREAIVFIVIIFKLNQNYCGKSILILVKP